MLRTGDLVLFASNGVFGALIRFFTRSVFTHVGMVLVDPPFGVPHVRVHDLEARPRGARSEPELWFFGKLDLLSDLVRALDDRRGVLERFVPYDRDDRRAVENGICFAFSDT